MCIPYGKKLQRIGTQDMFDGDNIGGLSIYAEGNQGKGKGWRVKFW